MKFPKIALASIVALSSCGAVAHAAADFRLERLTPREIHLAPSHGAIYALRIRNIGDTEGMAHVGSDVHSYYPSLDDFTGYALIQSGHPGCGEFGTEWASDWLNVYRTAFDAGPIAPASYLDCEMTVLRDSSSRHDMVMYWGVQAGTDESGIPQ